MASEGARRSGGVPRRPGRTGGLRLWWARLDPPSPRVEALADVLSAEELTRAGTFRFERDRRRFVVAHGMLRQVIAACTGMAAEEATFGHGPGGKPILTGPGHEPVHFSLSHSDERCLIGISRSGPVGVDVEKVRLLPEAASIARRFFSPCDTSALETLPPGELAGAFLGCWTRTEAYVKALGIGLAGAYDRRRTPCWACGGRRCGRAGTAEAMGEWSVVTLEPETGYLAAVATPKTGQAPQSPRP